MAGDETGKPTVDRIHLDWEPYTASRSGHPATGPSIAHGRDSEASECSAVSPGPLDRTNLVVTVPPLRRHTIEEPHVTTQSGAFSQFEEVNP